MKCMQAGVEFELTGDMYITKTKSGGCSAAYMQLDVPSQFGHTFVVGAVSWMRHFVTYYVRGIDGEVSKVKV